MKKKLLILVFVLALTTFACGQFQIGIENPTPNQTGADIDPPETDNPEPSITPVQDSVRDEEEKPDFSKYWTEVEDYRTGVRFAVPCFWVANIPQPEQDPTGLGSFSVNNFTEDFVTSLGPKRGGTVWEIGGMKFDLGYHRPTDMGLAPSANLEEIAFKLVNPDQEHGIDSTQTVDVGGRQVLQVETWGQFGDGRFYLLPVHGDLVILFAPFPSEIVEHPDIQGILQSFAFSNEEQVNIPTHMPAHPPEGMAASCIGVEASESSSGTTGDAENSFQGTLDCVGVTEDEKLMWVACNVQDMLRSRNTQAGPGYMRDFFNLAYWQSEGVTLTIEEAMREIEMNLLPATTGDMVFTTDEALFPPLFGMPAENMFGPDANIAEVIYSEGWGANGQGAALLYIAEDQNGEYYFYGMVIAQGHFDK